MGESLKAILQLIFVIAVITVALSWGISPLTFKTAWEMRIGGIVIAGATGWVFISNARRKETLPDMLGQITPRYFERGGFCFAFSLVVHDRTAWMQVFFQNRYERACQARVVLTPPKTFFLNRAKTQGIDAEITCDGAAFGVYRAPWPINEKLQGKKISCEVACSASYPAGSGRLVRFREGMRCGTPRSDLSRAAATLGLAAVGVVRVSRPATVRLQMPKGVAAEISSSVTPTMEILWRPDLPTGGFPVLPVSPSDQ
jgi:hypothetical protein